jgi:O-antigen ligase
VISLASVALFFIAYVESSMLDLKIFRRNLFAVALAFSLVCVASLVLLVSMPQLTFEVTPEGNRFRGVFNEPAMMGAVSGLLVGLAAFGKFPWLIRIIGVLAAVPCLYLTGSRTSWGAAVAGLSITGILYMRQKRLWVSALVFAGIVGVLGMIAIDLHISSVAQSRALRSESLDTMSGRTVLWNLALKRYWDSPLLGYGFTTGSDALMKDMGAALGSAFGVTDQKHQQSFSLHSGYMQALLDSGAIGAGLYLAILFTALWSLVRNDTERVYGAELYCLVFFTISNIADTIIFGAAVFYEVFYWYVIALALCIGNLRPESLAKTVSHATNSTNEQPASGSTGAGSLVQPPFVPTRRRFPLLSD